MELAFIQAPAWGRDCPPYTMCFLAALVREKGHKAHLFDFNNFLYHTSPDNLKKMWDDKDYYSYWEKKETVSFLLRQNEKAVDFYLDKILASSAKVIGFTVHFSSLWASLEIARKIKERDKNRIVVFGGPDCSKQQKGYFLIEDECVDIVVYGEGEEPLFEIINSVDDFKEVKSIKGCLILKNSKIIDGGEASILDDLDTLPLPDYSDFKDDIVSRTYREPWRLDIFDSRGCPTRCHFCSEWQFWKKFRSKSGRRIYEEVVYYLRNFPGVDYFYFIGSLLNGKIKALNDFCDLVLANNLKIRWAGQAIIRPEMTKDLLQKMFSAGCVWISYGIESGSQKVLTKMGKNFSLEVASRVLKDSKDSGISTQVNFMFGLPTETKEDFNLTLRFLRDNRGYIDTVLASQSFCVIDKGTYLYNNYREFGIRNKEHHLYWESNNGENNYFQRLRRYEKFCKVALSLGIPETSGVLRKKPDKWHSLGDYFFYKKDYLSAIQNYLNAESCESKSRQLFDKLSRCYEETGDYEKAVESLGRSLKVEPDFSNNGLSDEEVTRRLADLNSFLDDPKIAPASDNSRLCEDIISIESEKLAKVLRYYAKNRYQGVDLEKMVNGFNFGDKQKSMSRALYSHGLWVKLSNYILVNVQTMRKENFLFGYPYWLVIDPCNYCNLRCPFCPTGQKRDVRSKAKLSFEDFKAVIDKLGPYLIHIDLVNWGEPLLNDQVFEMVSYAKRYHIDLKIDSNLNHLDEKNAKKIVLSGLDKIVVSIDGLTEETYSKYRVGGSFQTAMDNLKILLKKRKELKKMTPYITWQFLVFRHNEGEIEKAISLGKKLGVDHVGITKAFIGNREWIPLNPDYSNYSVEEKNNDDLTYNYFKPVSSTFCSWPWEAIAINSNVSVSVCCSVEEEKDDFGDIFDRPFEDFWNSEKYLAARGYIGGQNKNVINSDNICFGCRHSGLINIDILSCHSFFTV